MAEQGGKACKFVRRRDRAVRLVAADHQPQIESVPGRHRRLEALFHCYEIIAAVTIVELAPPYVMLASDEASYISGATVPVTGGKPFI